MAKNNERTSVLNRLIQEAMGEGKVLGDGADPLRQSCPALWGWLSTVYVGRDNIKNPATLTIRLGPQGVLASLVDRDLCASVEATCKYLPEVFEALERALTGDTPAVKSWGRKEPHIRKRRPNN